MDNVTLHVTPHVTCERAFRDAADSGRPLTRRQGMNVLKTTSEGVYTRFLQRHRLREKRPEIETKISVERICAQLKDFHRRAEWIYSLLRITPAQIVQFDEIALSMSGSLSSAARRIGGPVPRQQNLCSI